VVSATAQKELIKRINCKSISTGHVPHVENPKILAEAILKSEKFKKQFK